MTRSALVLVLAATVLGGCLSKVPPEKRAGDPWRQTSEQLSRPTTLD